MCYAVILGNQTKKKTTTTRKTKERKKIQFVKKAINLLRNFELTPKRKDIKNGK